MGIKATANIFICFFMILFLSCSEIVEEHSQIKGSGEQSHTLETGNDVIISGKTDDPSLFKFTHVMQNLSLFGRNSNQNKTETSADSLNIMLDSVSESQFVEFFSAGDSSGHKSRLYVEPGDSITFEIRDGDLVFTGVKSDQHNFYPELKKFTADYGHSPYKGNLSRYKMGVQSIYEEKILFLENYSRQKNLSKEFVKIVRADLKFEYLLNLMEPRSRKAGTGNFYFNVQDGFLPLVQKESHSDRELFNFAEYFDDVKITEFTENAIPSSHYFKNALNAYLRNYFSLSEHSNYSKEKFLKEKEFIQTNLSGELENYAVARMLVDYNNNGFGYGSENIGLITEVIDEYEQAFDRSSYRDEMKKIREDLEQFEFELSGRAMGSLVVNTKGDTLGLAEVLQEIGKIKVIDFWAGWCPPCVRDLQYSKEFKKRISEEQGVVWVHLSVEKDFDTWKKDLDNLDQVINKDEHFFLIKNYNSALANFLKVKGIPRYVLLDERNRIILNHSPSPSDSVIFERQLKEIKLKYRDNHSIGN